MEADCGRRNGIELVKAVWQLYNIVITVEEAEEILKAAQGQGLWRQGDYGGLPARTVQMLMQPREQQWSAFQNYRAPRIPTAEAPHIR